MQLVRNLESMWLTSQNEKYIKRLRECWAHSRLTGRLFKSNRSSTWSLWSKFFLMFACSFLSLREIGSHSVPTSLDFAKLFSFVSSLASPSSCLAPPLSFLFFFFFFCLASRLVWRSLIGHSSYTALIACHSLRRSWHRCTVREVMTLYAKHLSARLKPFSGFADCYSLTLDAPWPRSHACAKQSEVRGWPLELAQTYLPLWLFLVSQMVICPKYLYGCLTQLWRYLIGTKELKMTSLEPNHVSFIELLLTLYVDASFSSGGSRSRTGITMYLVNRIDGSESLIQWASRRQTSMATSAPEAEVPAMAVGLAASIFLFDTLKELRLVKGSGPFEAPHLPDMLCYRQATDSVSKDDLGESEQKRLRSRPVTPQWEELPELLPLHYAIPIITIFPSLR